MTSRRSADRASRSTASERVLVGDHAVPAPPQIIATGAWTSPGSKGEFPRIRQPNSRASQGSRFRPRAVIYSSSGGGGWSAWSRKSFALLPHRLTEVARMLEGIMVVAAEPAPAITRATAAHRSRAAPGSDLSRSSRRRTRRRHHGRARRGRAFGRKRDGHRSRARAVLRRAFPPNGGPWNHRLYCRPCLFLGAVLASAMEWFLSKNFAIERIST